MLLKTTKTKKHAHAIFINMDTQQGYTSDHKGHIHPVVIHMQEGEEFDPLTHIVIGEVDEHTHNPKELDTRTEKKDTKTAAEKRVQQNVDLFKSSYESEKDSRVQADESEKFLYGEQWEAADEQSLQNQGRACLTINMMKPIMDLLSGIQRQNRTDIQVLPEESNDRLAADIVNVALRQIQHYCGYHAEETAAAWEQMALGRGAFLLDVDYSRHVDGDITVKYVPWYDLSIPGHSRPDGSDAHYVVVHPRVSMATLKAMYPDKADKIQADFSSMMHATHEQKSDVVHQSEDEYNYPDTVSSDVHVVTAKDKDIVDVTRKQYRILYVYEKHHKHRKVVFNAIENEYADVSNIALTDIELLKNLKDFSFREDKRFDRVSLSVSAGNVLLEERDSIFSDFNLVWFHANKYRDFWFGKIHESKDAQRELNKRSSTFMDIINKMASYGIGYSSQDTFENQRDENDFLENRMKPGFAQKFKRGFQQHIHEFEGIKVPTEIISAMQTSKQQLHDVMNVHPEALGTSDRAESGVALAQKSRQGLVGNEYLFDSLAMAKKRLGKLMIEAIQKIYTPERIVRMVEAANTIDPVRANGNELYPQLNPQELIQIGMGLGLVQPQQAQIMMQQLQTGQFDPQGQALLQKIQEHVNQRRRQEILDVLENTDLTRYDIKVTENSTSPTTMLSNFVILQDLFRGDPNAPKQQLIDMAPFLTTDVKQNLIQGIQAQQQAAAEAERAKYATEIQKTLIAKDGGTQGQKPSS